jgi:hypothetical protein
MKGTRRSEEQIIAILKQGKRVNGGGFMPSAWDQRADLLPLKAKYGGMESGDAKKKQKNDYFLRLCSCVAWRRQDQVMRLTEDRLRGANLFP